MSTPMVPPIANLLATVLRCDYPTARPLDQYPVTATRDQYGEWTLARGAQEFARFTPVSPRTRVMPTEIVTRETPGWAKVLAVIGAVVFLLGLLFLLVKEDKRTPAAVLEVVGADGRVLALQVRDDPNRLRYGIGAEY